MTDKVIAWNDEAVRSKIEEMRGKASALAGALEANPVSAVKDAFKADITSFTQGGVESPLYLPLKKPIDETFTAIEAMIKSVIGNLNNGAKLLESCINDRAAIEAALKGKSDSTVVPSLKNILTRTT